MNSSTNTGPTTSANPAASAAAPGALRTTSDNRNALILDIVNIIAATIASFAWNRHSQSKSALGGFRRSSRSDRDQTEIRSRSDRDQSGVAPAGSGARRPPFGGRRRIDFPASANCNYQLGGFHHG